MLFKACTLSASWTSTSSKQARASSRRPRMARLTPLSIRAAEKLELMARARHNRQWPPHGGPGCEAQCLVTPGGTHRAGWRQHPVKVANGILMPYQEEHSGRPHFPVCWIEQAEHGERSVEIGDRSACHANDFRWPSGRRGVACVGCGGVRHDTGSGKAEESPAPSASGPSHAADFGHQRSALRHPLAPRSGNAGSCSLHHQHERSGPQPTPCRTRRLPSAVQTQSPARSR